MRGDVQAGELGPGDVLAGGGILAAGLLQLRDRAVGEPAGGERGDESWCAPGRSAHAGGDGSGVARGHHGEAEPQASGDVLRQAGDVAGALGGPGPAAEEAVMPPGTRRCRPR